MERTGSVQSVQEVPINIRAQRFKCFSEDHLLQTAEMIKTGSIVALPFNGVFGLFGDMDNPKASERIYEAKNRPIDNKLIQVCLPEKYSEICDFSRSPYGDEQISNLVRTVHALGVILPASFHSPEHLVVNKGGMRTVLPIWTETHALRFILEYFRELGGRGLVGTSANKSGQPAHWRFKELAQDFSFGVHALVEEDFSHLPEFRRRSTSIVDLTGTRPRLHREGNVPEEEVREALTRHNFPELIVDEKTIRVVPRL